MWGVVLTFGAQYGIIYTSMCAMAQQKGNKYYEKQKAHKFS